MPRGGARPGAGRKPGTPNKATAEREALVREGGETPLDHMLAVMRNADEDPARRLEAAKAAAPYVHPRLSSVEHSGTLKVAAARELSDDDLAAIASGSSAGTVAPERHSSKPH